MKTINNRQYSVRKFTSIKSANDFMESNPEFGVIDYRQSDTIYIDKQEIVWLAKLSDLGKPLK